MDRRKYTSIRRAQVYGMRCSGTNYLDALLQRNFPSLELGTSYDDDNFTFGWKHGDVNTPGYSEHDGQTYHKNFTPLNWQSSEETLLLVVFRNPFNWLQSLHEHPWHAPELYGLPFSEFLQREWRAYYSVTGKDGSPDPAVRSSIMREENLLESYESVLTMRCDKIRMFESFKWRFYNVAFINYEDLRRNPERVIADIANAYGLEATPQFNSVTTYKGGKESYKGSMYDQIGTKDLRFILERANWSQERSVGYSLRGAAGLLSTTTMAHVHPEALIHITPRQRFYINGEQIDVGETKLQAHLRAALDVSAFVDYELREWQAAGS